MKNLYHLVIFIVLSVLVSMKTNANAANIPTAGISEASAAAIGEGDYAPMVDLDGRYAGIIRVQLVSKTRNIAERILEIKTDPTKADTSVGTVVLPAETNLASLTKAVEKMREQGCDGTFRDESEQVRLTITCPNEKRSIGM